MSQPPLGTLILSNLINDVVIGIDTHFFNVNNLLKGIKLIPPGTHLFHYSDSVYEGTAIRCGRWFTIKEGEVLHAVWNESLASFNFESSIPMDFGEIYNYMVKYPTNDSWTQVASYIDTESLEEYNPELVSTATPLREENMVLIEILRAKDPKQQFEDQTSEELRYTILQFQLAGPRNEDSHAEVTRNALDKSWYLLQLFGHDLELLLAELQISFIHFVVLGNMCSCTQWCNLLRLVLMSRDFLEKNVKFAETFLNIVSAQLLLMPEDYMGLEVIDMKDYVAIMENFSHTFLSTSFRPWEKVKAVNKRFNLNLGLLQSKFDEDNFEVYNMEDYDEGDEDAPALVDA